MKTVYLSGPYSKNLINVSFAIDVAEMLTKKIPGILVFIPHIFHYWDLQHQHDEKFWLDIDLEWLSKCDVVFRMRGVSGGADLEVARAKKLGKPVFFDVNELKEWSEK